MKNANNTVLQIELTSIIPDPFQPRKNFDENSIAELAQSIKANGLLQPIILRKLTDQDRVDELIVGTDNLNTDKQFMIVAGERRFKAHNYLNEEKIDAILRDYDDIETIREIQIIENLQRKDVTALEEAHAFSFLNTRMNAENIALKIGRSTPFVYQRLKLNNLIDQFQDLLLNKIINLKQSLLVADLKKSDQLSIFNDLNENYDLRYSINNHTLNNYLSKAKSSLKNACWNLNDDTLIPNANNCNSCTYNSKNNGFLFNDNEDPICSNNTCFQIKKMTSLFNFIQDRKKDKMMVVLDTYNDNISDVRNILQEQNFKILNNRDVESIVDPGKVRSLEEFIEDEYYSIDDLEEDEIKSDYNEYLKDHKTECEEYNSNIKSNKYSKAYLLNIKTYKYETIHIVIKPKKSDTRDIVKSIHSLKMTECTPIQKIIKIQEREARKKVIEGAKEMSDIHEISHNLKFAKTELSKIELVYSILTLLDSYCYKHEDLRSLNQNLSSKSYEELLKIPNKTLVGYRNKILRCVAYSNVNLGHEQSQYTKPSLKAYVEMLREKFADKVEQIENTYRSNETKRLERINERISELELLINN